MSNAARAPHPRPDPPAPHHRVPRWLDTATAAGIVTVTLPLIAAAATWFLLRTLTPVLRPLMIAIFLAYVLLPIHAAPAALSSPASIGHPGRDYGRDPARPRLRDLASMLELNDDSPRLHGGRSS